MLICELQIKLWIDAICNICIVPLHCPVTLNWFCVEWGCVDLHLIVFGCESHHTSCYVCVFNILDLSVVRYVSYPSHTMSSSSVRTPLVMNDLCIHCVSMHKTPLQERWDVSNRLNAQPSCLCCVILFHCDLDVTRFSLQHIFLPESTNCSLSCSVIHVEWPLCGQMWICHRRAPQLD